MAKKKKNSTKGFKLGGIGAVTSIAILLIVLSQLQSFVATSAFLDPSIFFKNMFGNRNVIADSNMTAAASLSNFYSIKGVASYYGKKFHGRKTANGEIFNLNAHTAAHRNLPFGTIVKVTLKDTDKSVFVRINDRGPFAKKRIIDLSKVAAEKLGFDGIGKVVLEAVPVGTSTPNKYLFMSYEEDLFFADLRLFEVMDSSNDFNTAAKVYDELISIYPGIFLSFDNSIPESERQYKICVLKSQKDVTMIN